MLLLFFWGGQADVYDMVCFLWCCVVSACGADGIGFEMDMREFADYADMAMLGEWYAGMEGDIEKKWLVGADRWA